MMKFYAKKSGLAVVFIVFSIHASSQLQEPDPVSIPSSNAQALGVFGEVPVSKFTGVPDINIPLHTVKMHQLGIPISMNYHGSGILPDVHPGWTGLGWAMQAGGAITRKVNGLQDELDTDLGGFYDNHSLLNRADWSSSQALSQYSLQNPFDGMPDEFDFNVNGISGSFYMNDAGNWQVKCDQDVKVLFDPNDFIHPLKNFLSGDPTTGYRAFGKFTIIGNDGTRYIFGGNNNAIDYSINFFDQTNDHWLPTSWYLTKIVSADNIQEIDLNYERDQYTNNIFFNYFRNEYYWRKSNCYSQPDGPVYTDSLIAANLISPVYLRSIETVNERILFDRSTSTELRYNTSIYSSTYQLYKNPAQPGPIGSQPYAKTIASDSANVNFLPLLHLNSINGFPGILQNLQWKKLDSISVYDKTTNKYIQRFVFSYNNTFGERLMLNSIQESNPSAAGNNSKPPYQLFYDRTQPLPQYLSRMLDDWGGFNGQFNTRNDFNIKDVYPAFSIAGTLNKIIYPTGGYSLFFFESNIYSGAGGLRIKAVFNYDPVSNKTTGKHYFYTQGYTNKTGGTASSGLHGNYPVNKWNDQSYIDTATHDTLTTTLYSYKSILPLTTNALGSLIGYSEVVEKNDDGSYTKYKFTNFDDGHADEGYINSLYPAKAIMNPFTSLSLERGQIKSVANYNANDSCLSRSVFQYAPIHNQKNFVKSAYVNARKVCNYAWIGNTTNYTPPSGPTVYEGVSYKIYTYAYVVVSKTDTIYDENGQNPVSSATNYYYDNPNNNLLTRTETTRTDGKIITSTAIYPQDYGIGTAFIDSMVSKNILALPVEKVIYLKDPVTGKVSILSGVVDKRLSTNPLLMTNSYSWQSNTPIILDSFKFSGRASATLPYSGTATSFQPDSRYQQKITYDNYDAFGNLLQYTVVNGPSGGKVWGYNNTLPVAEFGNATLNTIYYNGFEGDSVNISMDSRAGYKSKLLNGSVFSLPVMPALSNNRNYSLSYWYKNTGDTSWKFYQNNFAVLPGSITGPVVIDEVKIAPQDALLKSYSYVSPLIGMMTSNNEANIIGKYEYDPLNRLYLVRDDKNNIIKQELFSYSPGSPSVSQFYFSAGKTAVYRKNNCTGGTTGTNVLYYVPATTYISSISQANADSMALANINNNGQAYANANGGCYFYNTVKTANFYRTSCAAVTSYNPVPPTTYTVLAGKDSSLVSQGQADSLAQADINLNGQIYVNNYGICPPTTANIHVANNSPGTTGPITYKIQVTLTNTTTHAVYNIGPVSGGQSQDLTIPIGIYNIVFGTTYCANLQVYNNGQSQAPPYCDSCANLKSISNITIVSPLNIVMNYTGTCPAPN